MASSPDTGHRNCEDSSTLGSRLSSFRKTKVAFLNDSSCIVLSLLIVMIIIMQQYAIIDLSSIFITDHTFLLTARIFTTAKLQSAQRHFSQPKLV